MSRDFFQFPSWVVAELNKQAQPKQEAALLKPLVVAEAIKWPEDQPRIVERVSSIPASLLTRETIRWEWERLALSQERADEAFDKASLHDLQGSLEDFCAKFAKPKRKYTKRAK